MEEPEKRELLKSALPLLAIVLMASGIVVRTVPLASKRPADSEQAKFSHAGLQDVEARLWEDPFGAMRHIKGSTPGVRCKEAIEDNRHYPYALSRLIERVSMRRDITVLPVLIQGGPYFENGETRRRARFAVVTALLNEGWVPSDEDKMGYVWTFENCVEAPGARQIPELLPYEWFDEGSNRPSDSSDTEKPRRFLVLWVDEDAVSRTPLKGVERLAELLGRPETLCDPPPADETEGESWLAKQRQELAKKLKGHKDRGACFQRQESSSASLEQTGKTPCPDFQRGLPWCDMRVIGPSTSNPLQNIVGELARHGDPRPTRFYSATATADLNEEFSTWGRWAKSRGGLTSSTASAEELKARFDDRIVRLTAPDEKLVNAFVTELTWRLRDQTPWQGLVASWKDRPWPCDDTIVIVGEGDTSYARSFRQAFASQASAFQEKERCGRDVVVQVSYLRGLDGVLPTGTGAPVPSAPQQTTSGGTDASAKTIGDILPDRATLERADGRSQYDYLRRLGEHLIALDRRERQGGRRGVTAIGVLGNDTYDKLLVLDALRAQFPRAVFFAADLDARLMGREARRSTQNLVVASAYGLKLHRDLQGAAPPFRDTYQTGMYLATRVALVDSDPRQWSTDELQKTWFAKPRLFEIGRTRAVPLSQVNTGDPEVCKELDPQRCRNIHPNDEWRDFPDHLPDRWAALAVAVMALTTSMCALLLSDRAYTAVQKTTIWFNKKPSRWYVLAGGLVLALGLFFAGLWAVKTDVETGIGEPFAWLEGVSIWPTQILQMLLLILTGALFVLGRVWLRCKIDKIAEKFHVETLTDREKTPSLTLPPTMWTRVRWLWGIGGYQRAKTIEGNSTIDLWHEFLDRMRRTPTTIRVVCTTVLFFLFSLALLSLDWPGSPHRGILSAWFSHVLQILLLIGMTALLVSALDASMMATRLLRACLDWYREVSCRAELVRQALVERDPVERDIAVVQRAAEITSAANRLIYLPFLTFLLLVPMRSPVFDAWVFSLPYVVLIFLAVGVALLHTIALRREATKRRTEVLAKIDRMADDCARQAKPAQKDVSNTSEGESEPPASPKAALLKSRADQLRGLRDGPFRPFDQEPVVRALLLVLGGTGTLTIVEFLFLGWG